MGERGEEQRFALEEELHRLEAQIGRLRQQMLLLRGLPCTPARQARLEALARRYDELGAQFVRVYRQWNSLG